MQWHILNLREQTAESAPLLRRFRKGRLGQQFALQLVALLDEREPIGGIGRRLRRGVYEGVLNTCG